MIALERLAAYALGDLDDRESMEVDEHVLGCSECAAKVERMLAMGEAVRAIIRRGGVRVALTPAMLENLQREGLVTRTYHVARGGSVACTADATDVYVLAELEADLAGVARVDVEKRRGDHVVRMQNLPIDRSRGQVAYVLPGDEVRLFETGTDHLTLLAIDAEGERAIGTYTFNHTAFRRS
jgi:hypothetical protein